MKKYLLIATLTLSSLLAASAIAAVPQTLNYGIHLYFNETEFIDVLKIEKSATCELTGMMYVPNDFDGAVDNLKIDGKKITFDLFVPKNLSRPTDLIFHYEGQFFDASLTQLIGFVTIKEQQGFVASFTGFLRN